MNDPRLARAFSRHDFDLRDLKRHRMTVYLALPLGAMTALQGKPTAGVAFFLDEFGQLALVIGWAIGWSLCVLILISACLSLGFGAGFWSVWDAWQVRRRKRKLIALASDTGLRREEV